MNTLIRKLVIMITGALLLATTGLAQGTSLDVRGGTMACGGNHFDRRGGTELHITAWNFRNFNEDKTINLDSIKIYNANGMVVYDVPAADPFPAIFKSTLGFHQSTQLLSSEIFLSSGFSRSDHPLLINVFLSPSL